MKRKRRERERERERETSTNTKKLFIISFLQQRMSWKSKVMHFVQLSLAHVLSLSLSFARSPLDPKRLLLCIADATHTFPSLTHTVLVIERWKRMVAIRDFFSRMWIFLMIFFRSTKRNVLGNVETLVFNGEETRSDTPFSKMEGKIHGKKLCTNPFRFNGIRTRHWSIDNGRTSIMTRTANDISRTRMVVPRIECLIAD